MNTRRFSMYPRRSLSCPKEEYPEGICKEITIKIYRLSDQEYGVYCPEWNCEFYAKDPAKKVQELVSEIVEHNNEWD
jgi:hypothetical protein